MAVINRQLSEMQAAISKQLKRHEVVALKLNSCLDLHVHSNNIQNASDNPIAKIIDELHHAAKDVDLLELRMTIVATMKAGKSTIINALIGDNVLPTRGNAMTTLPTEVVFHRDTTHPTLVLTKEGIDLIVTLQHRIYTYLQFSKSCIAEIFQNDFQLVKIATDIFLHKGTGSHFDLSVRTTGLTRIQVVLTFVNDLVRVFLILSKLPNSDLKDVSLRPLLKQNIRLEVPAVNLHCENIDNVGASIGSLTLVDTPGPNEAAASDELHEIVFNELRKAAIVTLVLNYTAMDTQADEAIAKEIEAIREAKGIDDSIYIVVNKVDQRRRGDKSKADVKKHIATKYRIEERSDNDSDKRIFEMKAVHCLVLRRFFHEKETLENKSQIPTVKNMQTVDELINELYKFDDDEEKDLEQVCKDAKKMWKTAGFDEFASCAISNLIQQIVPLSLKSAMKICSSKGMELRSMIEERQNILNGDVGKVKDVRKQLREDCDNLQKLKENHKDKLEEQIMFLKTQLQRIMKKVSDECKQWANSSFKNDKWQSNFDVAKYYGNGLYGIGLLGGGLFAASCILSGGLTAGVAGAALAIAGAASGTSVLQNNDDSKSFATEAEAVAFIEVVHIDTNAVCDRVYKNLRDEIDTISSDINNSLLRYLTATTADIVAKINEKFKENFNIQFNVPKTIDIPKTELEIDSNMCVQKYQALWGYRLFGRKSLITSEKEINPSNIKLCVSRAELKKKCMTFIETYIEQLDKAINENFKEELEKTFHSYFDNLHKLFNRYINVLNETLEMTQNQIQKQIQYKADLEMILREIKKESKNVEKLMAQLETNLKLM